MSEDVDFKVPCRGCRVPRDLSEFRLFRSSPDRLYMDFCRHCEQREGTVTLYRRFFAYATTEIADAVFTAERVREHKRTDEQKRLLVQPSSEAPTTNEELVRRELARRELAKRRLVFFALMFYPDYKPTAVHHDICRRLERFVEAIERGESPRLMIAMPPRHGKQVAHSTPVLTHNRGWTTHGDLRVGDQVFHPSGRPVRVLALSDESPQDCEVEMFDGSVVACHENHEWTVYDRARAAWRTVETRYLESQTLTSGVSQRARFQLPLYDAVEGTPQALSIDPYFLGAWLGDGASSKPVICGAVDDLEHVISLCPYELGYRAIHKTTGVHYQGFKGVGRLLRATGVVNNKHIPAQYLCASVEQRRRLLEGLVDTDGSVEADTQRVRFRSSSARLANDVALLVRSLGYRASVDFTPADTRERHIVGGESWCVQWTPHDGRGGGTLPRKQVSRIRKRRRIGIKAVRRVSPSIGRCIQVASPDGLYLVGDRFTPTHNSLLASDIFPSWVLGRHPEWAIIAASHTQSLPIEFSRNIRDRINDNEYRALFPKTALRKDSQAVDAWKLTEGGGYIAAGVGVAINGKGMTIGIADDLIKDALEAQSEKVRDNTYAWYQTVFRLRLAPAGGILLIGTRWHDNDVQGRELSAEEMLRKEGVPEAELEGWDVVSYPALATDNEYLTSDGKIFVNSTPPPDEPDARVLRKKDEALHPERYNRAALMKLKHRMSSQEWSALYQQNPTPDDGDFFKRSDFRYRRLTRDYWLTMRRFITFDFAISTRTSAKDYTVGGVFALGPNRDLYLLDVVRGRWKTQTIVQNIVQLVLKYKPEVFAGERGQIYEAVWPLVRDALNKEEEYLSFDETLVPLTDKEVRARPLQGLTQVHKLIFSYDGEERPEIYTDVERELLRFPNGTNDDIVDMLAWGARLAQKMSPAFDPAPAKPQSWKDRVSGITGTSHMAS